MLKNGDNYHKIANLRWWNKYIQKTTLLAIFLRVKSNCS